MKIIKIDKKEKEIIFIPETIEDLWVIKSIVEPKDIIKGTSYRRQRIEATSETYRKTIYISIIIEKIEYNSQFNALRFTGKIIEGGPPEFAPLGEYHTLEIELNEKYILKKQNLFQYQIELLQNTSKQQHKIKIIAIDDEQATIYELTNIGITEITKIYSGKSGKRYKSENKQNEYFEKLYNLISKEKEIIIAGPGYTKNKLEEHIKSKINTIKIICVPIQNISKSAISELFTKKEIQSFFEKSIEFKENELLNKFKEELGKNTGKAIYGLQEIEKTIETGAIESLLISENLWKENIDKIQEIIKKGEKTNTKIHIVDKDRDNNKTLNAFGGIIGILRYKI